VGAWYAALTLSTSHACATRFVAQQELLR
jgi:hypothetical protein